MIILLRGHIRDAFDTSGLYMLLSALDTISPLSIYIHTWSIQQSSLSWRDMEHIPTQITEDRIRAYFKGLFDRICALRIDDDGSLPLIGDVSGYIQLSTMPKRGWKNMWAGMYGMMKRIAEECPGEETILNTRFDALTNSHARTAEEYTDFYKAITEDSHMTDFKFIQDGLFDGCDNYYFGNVKNMYKLIESFHTKLDTLLLELPPLSHQERLVMIQAGRLAQFENPPPFMQVFSRWELAKNT